MVVGDARRDLVAEAGGLVRHPAGQGFGPHWTASLLRQDEMAGALVAGSAAASPRRDALNGRPTDFLDLVHPDGFTGTLGIDVETGIWSALISPSFTIKVDAIVLDPPPSKAFRVLEVVPDVDLTDWEPVADTLAPVLEAVREAAGRVVRVRGQDPASREFDFVLMDDDLTPIGRITRRRAEQIQSPAHFPGGQAWIGGDDWEYHVDLADGDVERAWRIVDVVSRLV